MLTRVLAALNRLLLTSEPVASTTSASAIAGAAAGNSGGLAPVHGWMSGHVFMSSLEVCDRLYIVSPV